MLPALPEPEGWEEVGVRVGRAPKDATAAMCEAEGGEMTCPNCKGRMRVVGKGHWACGACGEQVQETRYRWSWNAKRFNKGVDARGGGNAHRDAKEA